MKVLQLAAHETFTHSVVIQYLFKSSEMHDTSSETCHEYFRMLISASQKDHLSSKKAGFHERWQEKRYCKNLFKKQSVAPCASSATIDSVPFPPFADTAMQILVCVTRHIGTEANKQLSKLIPIPKTDVWFSQRISKRNIPPWPGWDYKRRHPSSPPPNFQRV